jgi:hypothetical protein
MLSVNTCSLFSLYTLQAVFGETVGSRVAVQARSQPEPNATIEGVYTAAAVIVLRSSDLQHHLHASSRE